MGRSTSSRGQGRKGSRSRNTSGAAKATSSNIAAVNKSYGQDGNANGHGSGDDRAGHEELRRRITSEILSGGGIELLNSGGTNRLALEVLYLLPSGFTTAYELLYYIALKDELTSSAGGSPDTEKIKEYEKWRDDLEARAEELESKGKGARGAASSALQIRARLAEAEKAQAKVEARKHGEGKDGAGRKRVGRLASQGGGKKYKKYWTIRNEAALSLKHAIDSELKDLGHKIEMWVQMVDRLQQVKNEKGRGQGMLSTELNAEGIKAAGTEQCNGCHRFMKHNWVFCPYCGIGDKK